MTVPCQHCKDGTVKYGSGWKTRTARCATCAGTGLVVAADDHDFDRWMDELATGDPYATAFEPSWGVEHVCMDALALARDSLTTPDLTGFDHASPSEATPSARTVDDRPGAPSTS